MWRFSDEEGESYESTDEESSSTASESEGENGAANLKEAKKQLKEADPSPAPVLDKRQMKHLAGWGSDFLGWSGLLA